MIGTKKNYSDLLRDPRWQKKRLQILERDDFTCQGCGDKENTLHVHHKYYTYGKKPWEYSDQILITLCNNCHLTEEYYKTIIKDFTKVLLCDGYLASEINNIIKILRQLPPGKKGLKLLSDFITMYKNK